MPIIECPSCKRQLQLGEDNFGHEVKCPLCGGQFVAGKSAAGGNAPSAAAEPIEAHEAETPKRVKQEGEKYCHECGAIIREKALVCPECGVAQGNADEDGPYGEVGGKKIAAGICGILLGAFGVHKFILGITTPAVIMLLVTLLTCGIGGFVMHIIGIVEGVIYLTASDKKFYRTYMIEKKGWF
jgi:TM2 domain-containing membrane protein YozV/predicted RNA-binding Zn-ribbon protein involved in translation (DUF1610 family)